MGSGISDDDRLTDFSESETEVLTNALEESRRTFDKEIETINEIDDKAMRVARTGVIVIGIVVSVIAVLGPEAIVSMPSTVFGLSIVGVGLIFGSIVYAYGTIAVTEFPTGIGSPHREEAKSGAYTEREWLMLMLSEYDSWVDEVEQEVEQNVVYLEETMLLLLVGLLLLSLAAGVGYLHEAYDIAPLYSTFAFLVALALFPVAMRMGKMTHNLLVKFVSLVASVLRSIFRRGDNLAHNLISKDE